MNISTYEKINLIKNLLVIVEGIPTAWYNLRLQGQMLVINPRLFDKPPVLYEKTLTYLLAKIVNR